MARVQRTITLRTVYRKTYFRGPCITSHNSLTSDENIRLANAGQMDPRNVDTERRYVTEFTAEVSNIKNVLFCSEDVSFDANAIIEAGRLCEKAEAVLHIGHIVTKVGDDYKIDELESLLNQYFPNLNYIIQMVEDKSPLEGIERMVEKSDVDLMVFNTKHRNFFTRWLHESVTEHIALYTKKPILVFHKD